MHRTIVRSDQRIDGHELVLDRRVRDEQGHDPLEVVGVPGAEEPAQSPVAVGRRT
jgi:hypothetical protein